MAAEICGWRRKLEKQLHLGSFSLKSFHILFLFLSSLTERSVRLAVSVISISCFLSFCFRLNFAVFSFCHMTHFCCLLLLLTFLKLTQHGPLLCCSHKGSICFFKIYEAGDGGKLNNQKKKIEDSKLGVENKRRKVTDRSLNQ